MIYVKSFLAGVAALIIAALITVAAFFAAPIMELLAELLAHRDVGIVSFYVNSPFLHIWTLLVGALLIFAAGFYWAFKRSKAREPRTGSF
jgi:H+/Cl- antiporter ClcA